MPAATVINTAWKIIFGQVINRVAKIADFGKWVAGPN